MAEKMLILKGRVLPGWPNGALDEGPALAFAARKGYDGEVVPMAAGMNPSKTDNQTLYVLARLREDKSITALYGFSGGGYNLGHVIDSLTDDEKKQIRLVVVLGCPVHTKERWKGPWGEEGLYYRLDPPEAQGGHIAGPRALLAELGGEPKGP
jgi:hypothetical protein